jgi:hypothetical protein
MYEERREVVADDAPDTEVRRETVTEHPSRRVVEETPPTYVDRSDPVRNTAAAGNLINTLVWAVVVIVILVVGILVLLHYGII